MSPEEEVLTLTAQLPADIAAIFIGQWHVARGSWELDDVLQRLRAHVAFMAAHEWDPETQRWKDL